MIIELVAIFFFGALFGVLTNYKLALVFLASTPITFLKILLLWKVQEIPIMIIKKTQKLNQKEEQFPVKNELLKINN